MTSKKTKEYVIVDATLNWAFFDKVSEMSEKYQVDVSNLSEGDQDKLREIGLGPRLNEDDLAAKEKKWKREGRYTADELAEKMESMPDKGIFMTVKSDVKKEQWRSDDNDLRWFSVTMFDTQEAVADLSIIGNGTKARVKIEAVPYNNTFGTGLSAGLSKVAITDLSRYERVVDDEMYSTPPVTSTPEEPEAFDMSE